MTSSNIRGSCLCGAVTFEVNSPYHIMTHCHCSRCRKSTGAGHSTNIAANSESIRWLSGYESITRFELPGSERFGKWFCSHCGGTGAGRSYQKTLDVWDGHPPQSA
ncbi:MAG: hypothetical protein B7X04_02520 [Parcubacteria group bacterium 21-54-25]|nr:MAG: hypothetical protein B7X04_02520 [Parcubacteria group bacterium 21-54-25]